MGRRAWVGRWLCWAMGTLCGLHLHAHNLRITQLACDGTTLNLTVAWDHAWNMGAAPGNHDAVWVFGKVRTEAGWEPLRFSQVAADHDSEAPDRVALDPAPDGRGLLVKTLLAPGGSMPETRLELRLLQPIAAVEYELMVMGVEMAWVPDGPYWLGDGASNFALRDSSTGQPRWMDSEDGLDAAALAAAGGKGPSGSIPAAFPKGYRGFYLMKYELSQSQYADFLNALAPAQQRQRSHCGPDASAGTLAMAAAPQRSGIVLQTPATPGQSATFACDAHADGSPWAADDAQDRACNWLAWDDLAAYLDWAGLRPITELEFEKACRGPLPPLADEFAWGTDAVLDANTPVEDGTAHEAVAEQPLAPAGLASHGYAGPQGPLRCGFAAHDSSDRRSAGAGYYGHMELSGNLWELCVSTTGTGLGFTGMHGDGILDADGNADVAGWPGAAGAGYKGGGWNSGVIPGFRDLAVSDRFYIDLPADQRRGTCGGRGGL